MEFVQLLSQLLNGHAVLKLDAASLASLLMLLGTITTGVQAMKKLLENAASYEWLIGILPGPLKTVFNSITGLAKGYGPVVINLVLTFLVMGTTALQDGTLSGGEIWGILAAAGANDLLYKFFRKFIYTKGVVLQGSVPNWDQILIDQNTRIFGKGADVRVVDPGTDANFIAPTFTPQ